MMRARTAMLAAAALAEAAVAQGSRKPVTSIADLPRHSYAYRGDVGRLLERPDLLDPIAAQAQRDLQATLAGYAVTDRTTLRELHENLAYLAAWRCDDATVRREVAIARGYADKALDRATLGNQLLALADARATGARSGTPAFATAFAAAYARQLAPVPWAVYGDRASERIGRDATVSRAFFQGAMVPLYQPQVDRGGALDDHAALDLIYVAQLIRDLLPLKTAILATDRDYLATHRQQRADIWRARDVTLSAADRLTPVVVAIWDGGFDTTLFPGRVWTNPREVSDGRDEDGDGWIDDVHGVGLDEDGARVASEMIAPPPALAADLPRRLDLWAGFAELGAGDLSPRATRAETFLTTASATDIQHFFDDADFLRGWYHGTHVAGIVAAGNPAVRLMTVRRNFEWRTPPRRPTEAIARAYARGYKDQVAFMRAAGVRVANMSWTVDIKTEYEDQLAANGVPAAERAAEASRLFAIEASGLTEALRSAPDILFVCAAGNSNNSAAFQGSVPASLDLPNVLTVAAVGADGQPTSFTTLGPTVRVAANGYRVDSVIPGGGHLRSSGTSMASPQVVNAAAKLLAVRPSLTVAKLRALLIGETRHDGGVPLLNARAAMARLRSEHTPVAG